MIRTVRIRNYKCYSDHTVCFEKVTIAVGKNNAGKSTLVEVLRLLSIVTARIGTTRYYPAPAWTGLPNTYYGISPSLKTIDIELDRVINAYKEPPAIIEAVFDDNSKVKIFINEFGDLFALIYNSNNYLIKSKTNSAVERINVLPQITPLTKIEHIRVEDTIRNNLTSRLMSTNFRNQLEYYQRRDPSTYEKFTELVEATWSSIQIREIVRTDDALFLNVREKGFVTEIYYMGHGIQMWLQTMWFISRIEDNSIIILDEPDVYMHPDLQRKLIRMLKNKYQQIIVATHSIEIISEVQPSEILIIDKDHEKSILANCLPVVQNILNGLGSVHNIALSRLSTYKRYLYVEGNDLEILRCLYNTLFPDSDIPLDNIPSTHTGGWGSWDIKRNEAIKTLQIDNTFKIYFLYDRDYHTDDEIEERIRVGCSSNLQIYIWNKKEIENYLIIPSAICRFLSERSNTSIQIDDVNNMLDDICETMKLDTRDHLADEILKRKKKNSPSFSQCRKDADVILNKKWNSLKEKLSIVGGKEFITKLSDICQSKFGVSIGKIALADFIKKDEIEMEVANFLSSIEKGSRIKVRDVVTNKLASDD